MPKKVPYLHEEQIECDAATLLAEFERARVERVVRAVPIEDIIEKHLKLSVEFDDMHQRLRHPRSGFGVEPEILGEMFFGERRIVIDECLDPEENPSVEGRYRFALAHEVGHWRLHRHLFGKDPMQVNEPMPSIFCSSSQAKEPIEWQANFYASCLLMPRKLVMAAWDVAFPDRKPRILKSDTPFDYSFVEFNRETYVTPARIETETDEQALDRFATPFAKQFLVSPIDMRIRLEKLGLLHRTVARRRLLSDGS